MVKWPGKGGGYSDLEYALCRQAGLVDEDTLIVTTVHSMQWSPIVQSR